MNGTCLGCRNLNGCSLLIDPSGSFLTERVITEQNFSLCPQWTPISEDEFEARQLAYEMAGTGALRGLHCIDELVFSQPELGDVYDMTNLREIIKEGMTRGDRREQLLYLTDESGEFLLDDAGEKTLRGSLPLRQYAIDPEGPVGESPKRIIGWTNDQLLDAILDVEETAGLIAPEKKRRGRKPKAKQEEEMPRMLTRTPGSDSQQAQPTVPSKVAQPATGGRRSLLGKSTQAPAEAPAEETPQPTKRTAGATTQNLDGLADAVAAKVIQAVLPAVKEEFERLTQNLDYTRDRLVQVSTVLHDLIVTLGFDAGRMNEEALLIPSGGSIEEYLGEEEEGN